MKRDALLISTGIGIAVIIVITFSLQTDLSYVEEKLSDDDKFPDVHANFVYRFPHPKVAEEIDKSIEPKAWIAYDGSAGERPFIRINQNLKQNEEPSHIIAQQFIDSHQILMHVISQRTNTWISVDTARSILQDDYADSLIAGSHGSCGQYRYIWTKPMMIPTSDNKLVFVSIVWPEDSLLCYNNPEVPVPSLGGSNSLDFTDVVAGLYGFVYSNLVTISITWIILLGVLIWRGTIRKIWLANGFNYNIFELMIKMRGSRTRLEILMSLDMPKTRQQIAYELNIDWKAVDRHIDVLLKNNLIIEVCNVARVRYYIRSEKSEMLLKLLNNRYSSNY